MKADDRGIEVEFAAADAFQLERLARRLETVLDCVPHLRRRRATRIRGESSVGWSVAAIEPDRLQARIHDDGAPAWVATVKRIAAQGASADGLLGRQSHPAFLAIAFPVRPVPCVTTY
jgi:hypothetical protein